MKFKVGEKAVVIVCDNSCEKYKGKTGTIIDTDRIKHGYSNYWDYEMEFSDGFCYVFSDEEIEKVIIKNKQLLFEFME